MVKMSVEVGSDFFPETTFGIFLVDISPAFLKSWVVIYLVPVQLASFLGKDLFGRDFSLMHSLTGSQAQSNQQEKYFFHNVRTQGGQDV